MAAPSPAVTSIAAAILPNVSHYGYKEMVLYINERDAVSVDSYKKTKLAEYFSIDTSQAFKNGCTNPKHIFELFGDFSSHDVNELCILLLKSITRNLKFHQKCSIVYFKMGGISFKNWVEQLGNDRMYCDKLGLLALSLLYWGYAMVLTTNKLWSSIEHNMLLNLLDLLSECSEKLVYLGHLRFGELHQILKLHLALPVISSSPPPNSSHSVNTPPVVTAEQPSTSSDKHPVKVETEFPKGHVETGGDGINVGTNAGSNSDTHVKTSVPKPPVNCSLK